MGHGRLAVACMEGKIGGHIVTSRQVTQSAVGDKRGQWTTVVAAAVLL